MIWCMSKGWVSKNLDIPTKKSIPTDEQLKKMNGKLQEPTKKVIVTLNQWSVNKLNQAKEKNQTSFSVELQNALMTGINAL